MDAKVGDWVVTPRRGKAVEINALWYNALCLLRGWLEQENQTAAVAELTPHIDRAGASFNERFWNRGTGCLFDVVDGETGDDPAIRPNQVLAISLAHPVLAQRRWPAVLEVVQRELVTPVGLRSLAPGHDSYQPRYDGNLRMRDAAYHQGTVWSWLIGPFVDAWLKVHPDDRAGARQFLDGPGAPPERSGHRLDQRNLRRRGTLPPSRLHRPGLEHRRGAALLGEHGVTPQEFSPRNTRNTRKKEKEVG